MDADEKVSTLRSICSGITAERASELLEAANGSLERAVEIFFHQQQQQQQDAGNDEDYVLCVDDPNTASGPTTSTTTPDTSITKELASPFIATKKRPPSDKKSSSPSKVSGRKQARLDVFFGAASSNHHHHRSSTPPKKEASMLGTTSTTTRTEYTLQGREPEIIDIDESSSDDTMTLKHLPSESAAMGNTSIPTPPRLKGNSAFKTSTTEISFEYLAETLQQLTDTTKRLVKLDILKKFITHIIITEPAEQVESSSASASASASASTANTLACALLLVLGFRGGNQQAPMEIGGSALSKALQTILGASRMQLSKGYRQYGDMGDAAASLFQKKTFFTAAATASAKSLTILQVYESFEKIVATDGREAKQHILLQLLRACNSKIEIRFLVRLLIGNMRVGANVKTVLAALAMAFAVREDETKRAVEIVQKTHDVCPNLNAIITALLKGGVEQVQKDCSIQLLTPIAPMLAHPTHSLEQVAKVMVGYNGLLNNCMTMEWKYDGVRCQAHSDGTTMKLFSRHMLETTTQYPDAAKAILEARCDGDNNRPLSFILDAEIVGVEGEGEDMRLLPFQDLSRRKKNHDGQGVRVKVFAFDLMYLNGVSYINQPLHQRQAKLEEYFQETNDFAFVTSQPLSKFDESRICAFLEEAVRKGAEGLMLKMLGTSTSNNEASEQGGKLSQKISSPYEAGTRSNSWLKVKRDYVSGYADTIDVVPIGAWYGSGRKAQKSFLSPILLAVYDEEDDVYRSISRCMTFTDAMYEGMREFYFHGTAYPSDVGVDGAVDEGKDGNIEPDAAEEEDEDGESDVSDEEDEQRDGMAITEAGESRVNCFENRPSSAYVVTNESPPIWFKPMEVFEVSFADMSLSRQHTAGAGLVDDPEGRGVALRFPRFKRRRPDKKPEQATTSFQIAQLFAQQSKQASNSKRGGSKP